MHSSELSILQNRLQTLRASMAKQGLSGVIIPRFDEHQGEYCAPHDNRLAYVTGFSGSAGVALILADRAVIFVDGRYQVQVRGEISMADFEVEHYDDAPLEQWLEKHAQPGQRIGFNPMLIPTDHYRKLKTALDKAGGELVSLAADPVDAIWTDQPEKPLARINNLPIEYAGESSVDKRKKIAETLAALGADFLVETQPDNIAWLLNVRGGDVAFNPVPHSFLLLDRSEAVEWFVDERKLPNARDDYELDGVAMRDPADFIARIAERAEGRTVVVDPEYASVAASLAVENNGGTVILKTSPVTLAKAIKNGTELSGFRRCHVEDGAAWTSFLAWLHAEGPKREAAGNPVTELEAEDRILDFRRLGKDFVEPSFRSISASSDNAAMCHYFASAASNKAITSGGHYLLDSGGQYLSGTTDATRTTALGPVSDKVRTAYTAVLRGFISMMTLQFPAGTLGHQIDAFARRFLWDIGLDYDHGTGHGVGHFLSVHENPHRFQKQANNYKLEPGLVMTVEPGYYLEGEFGLRVENQVEVVEGPPGFLRFETLTLVPIDLALADLNQLNPAEIAFLDQYHARVRAALIDKVVPEARAFLIAKTEPLASYRAS